MVYQSVRNCRRVVDELYITRVLLAFEDILFFSLYSFFSIAKQVMTLKQLRLLSCPDFLDTNFKRVLSCFLISHVGYQYHLRLTPPVTPAGYRRLESEVQAIPVSGWLVLTMVPNWRFGSGSRLHQQNVFKSLEASRSV
jgi:hypothetical protein